ncbi:disulfide isomerase [Salpingoeca rosetta]|uniref:Protein disulfide-isomerase n=1 Tax=Salpingoeca rosetta (strain ATCC 50818 / BSB-021) TaxID=946362 RepID=F2UHF4_SALR5|nr:disulfide isomerase [Salpingoeca rosetta]EGD76553.1 disulfide isomerase [Salpingoeca rosetta]|eukprot:XP_004991467.1 disulfide isomerase [Salpingoeca rosetta]
MMTSAVAALLVLVAVVAAAGTAQGSDVVTLTTNNFASTLKERPLALVEFYAPWCGHCKRLEPEYEKAATELAKTGLDIMLAKVDATEESALASQFGVRGYPTIKLFRNGEEFAPYEDQRTASAIVKYMKKQATPSAVELSDMKELDALLASDETAVVAFLKNSDRLKSAFQKSADANRDSFRFAYTRNEDALAKYGENKIVVFQPKKLQNKFEEPTHTYDGEPRPADITAFVADAALGKVGVMTEDTRPFLMKKTPLLVVYFDLNLELNPSRVKYVRNRVLKAQSKANTDLTWAVANKDGFRQDIEAFGITSDIGVAIHGSDGKKYRMDDDWSVDAMVKFAEAFAAGEVEPHVKSEPIPEKDDDNVRTVVGKNFDDVVVEDKDVFIEFYAPWCGHCKKLAPTWSELGDEFADDDNVVIAKIDATANDFPSTFPVRGYPSIFFVPAGSTTPKKYDGGRDVTHLVDYVNANRKSAPAKKAASKDEL